MKRATRAEWSLGGRLTRIFLWSTLGCLLALAAMSTVVLERGIENSIDRLVEEEIEEMRSQLGARPLERELFLRAAATLARRHPRIEMGWRAFDAAGAPLLDAGKAALASHAERALPDRSYEHVGHATRRAGFTRGDGTSVVLVLDAREEFEPLWSYLRWTAAAVAVSALLALAIARWFSRRVSALLASVAEHARVADPDAPPVSIPASGAPREIRAVVDALQEMLARIRGEENERRVYLAGFAHELRAPLQNLLAEAEHALRRPRTAEQYGAVLASQLDELHALGDAIDNFIAISRPESPHHARAREEFDLAEEMRIRFARESATAAREGVEIALDVRGDTRVVGDREALLRAVRNLIQNAIQWSPRGSRVEVSIAGERSDLEVVVDDAGPGVPAELRAAIFEPFLSGPPAQGRRAGYGLGLALVKRAVDAQGGAVVVESSPQGGARFRLRIPRARGTPVRADRPEHQHVA